MNLAQIEPEWIDENEALDIIKISRRCSLLTVLEAHLATALEAGVSAGPGGIDKAGLLNWLETAFQPTKGKLGRPQDWDWEGALAEAERVMSQYQMRPYQARINEAVALWFGAHAGGDEPHMKDIHKRVRPAFRKHFGAK